MEQFVSAFAIGFAFLLTVYLFSYCIGKGWFKAKLEFHQQHMKWMNKELDNG